jgi:hypothetical protein
MTSPYRPRLVALGAALVILGAVWAVLRLMAPWWASLWVLAYLAGVAAHLVRLAPSLEPLTRLRAFAWAARARWAARRAEDGPS